MHAGVAVVANNTWAALQGRRHWRSPGIRVRARGRVSESYREIMRRPQCRRATRRSTSTAILTPCWRRGRVSTRVRNPVPVPCDDGTDELHGVIRDQVEIWSPTQFPDWATSAPWPRSRFPQERPSPRHPDGWRLRPTDQSRLHGRSRPAVEGRGQAGEGGLDPDGRLAPRFLSALRHAPDRRVILARMDCPTRGAIAWPTPPSRPLQDRSRGTAPKEPTARNMSYRIPNRSVEYTMLDSGVPRGWWRAVSTTHAIFAVESFIDELAAAAGQDPVAYRLALIDRIPGQKPDPATAAFAFDPERLKGVLRLAAEKAGWGKPLPAGHAMGVAVSRDHRSYAAEVVEVATIPGGVRIVADRLRADCGPVMNPTGARAQVEGGIMQALSAATKEAITIAGGAVDRPTSTATRCCGSPRPRRPSRPGSSRPTPIRPDWASRRCRHWRRRWPTRSRKQRGSGRGRCRSH